MLAEILTEAALAETAEVQRPPSDAAKQGFHTSAGRRFRTRTADGLSHDEPAGRQSSKTSPGSKLPQVSARAASKATQSLELGGSWRMPAGGVARTPRSARNAQEGAFARTLSKLPTVLGSSPSHSEDDLFELITARTECSSRCSIGGFSTATTRGGDSDSDGELLLPSPPLPGRSRKGNKWLASLSVASQGPRFTRVDSDGSAQDSEVSTECSISNIPSSPPHPSGGRAASKITSAATQSTMSTSLTSGFHASVAAGQAATRGEVDTFRSYLTKRFGNLTRAWREIARHAHSATNRERLSEHQFEEVVISYLKYGDRILATQLFRALSGDDSRGVGLAELVNSGTQHDRKAVLSLVDFRRLVQQHHVSLVHAFRELEDFLLLPDSEGTSSHYAQHRGELYLEDFMNAAGFYGLEEHQAVHCFHIMDADNSGSITSEEFMRAMTRVPRCVLLQDFRERALAEDRKLATFMKRIMREARVPDHLGKSEFVAAVQRIGVVEVEAVHLFELMDTNHSKTISSRQLHEALREGAPPTTSEDFWRKFGKEWPLLTAVAHQVSTGTRQRVGALLAELLSDEELKYCEELSPMDRHLLSTFDHCTGLDLDCVHVPHSAPLFAVSTVTFEVFDQLASSIDVTPEDSKRIFEELARGNAQVALARRLQEEDGEQVAPLSMDVDAFIEELRERTGAVELPKNCTRMVPRAASKAHANRAGSKEIVTPSDAKRKEAAFRRARTVEAFTKQLQTAVAKRRKEDMGMTATRSLPHTSAGDDA